MTQFFAPLTLTLAAALALPALAQDADPAGQLIEGYVACVLSAGDPDVVVGTLEGQGWTQTDGLEGMITLVPGAGEASQVLLADDGSFCHVESFQIDSATSSELLAATLESAGVTDVTYDKDEMGCTVLAYGASSTATITSGGNDPTCGSETDSAVRFATE